MPTIEDKLHERGLAFRRERPQRRFVDAKQAGDLVYLSGHGPEDEHGHLPWVGKVGREVTIEEGYQAARRVAVNCLGSLKVHLGELERIDEVIKVLGFVNSAPDFHRQPEVMHGFTDLLLEVLGERGRHARSAIGTNTLPNDQPVEVEMIVKVRV
ncbi:MAG: RidA family protein [Trueperaceae bacterium]|nr:RidA family protein [Trueperaceae bacterium]